MRSWIAILAAVVVIAGGTVGVAVAKTGSGSNGTTTSQKAGAKGKKGGAKKGKKSGKKAKRSKSSTAATETGSENANETAGETESGTDTETGPGEPAPGKGHEDPPGQDVDNQCDGNCVQ